MSQARRDDQRTRFRRPLGVAVMAYKAVLGLSEIVVGVLLAVPSFDPQATFARLSAEELREDPGDRFVALISRRLPALVHYRGLVAVGLVLFGLAKLVAAAAMWEGREWGGYLLAATVALLLPFDVRQAVGSRRPAMSCWPWRTRPCWLCWSCCCVGGYRAGRAGAQQARPRRLPRHQRAGSQPPWPARWRTAGRRATPGRRHTRSDHRQPAHR
jgi:uncharacterized membrane protein